MIRHICMFKLQEENKAENLMEAVKRAQSLKQIPSIKRFEVTTNHALAAQDNYDIALIFDYDDMQGLEEYQVHPVHKQFGAFIHTVRESRACIDFEF